MLKVPVGLESYSCDQRFCGKISDDALIIVKYTVRIKLCIPVENFRPR